MSIRPMGIADLVEVARLEQQLFNPPWRLSQLEQAITGNHLMWVVQQDAAIAGYLIASQGGGVADLLTIGVDPTLRRSGIGRRLMSVLFDQLRAVPIEELFLEVRCSNAAAIALYQRCGMAQVGVRKAYYPAKSEGASGLVSDQREDALVMRYLIPAES